MKTLAFFGVPLAAFLFIAFFVQILERGLRGAGPLMDQVLGIVVGAIAVVALIFFGFLVPIGIAVQLSIGISRWIGGKMGSDYARGIALAFSLMLLLALAWYFVDAIGLVKATGLYCQRAWLYLMG